MQKTVITGSSKRFAQPKDGTLTPVKEAYRDKDSPHAHIKQKAEE